MNKATAARNRLGLGALSTVVGTALALIVATISPAAAAGALHTAELTLGAHATRGASLGESVALSANGKVAILGDMLRTAAIGGIVPAQVFTLTNGK